MGKSEKKAFPLAVVIIGLLLFVGGYLLGSYVPLSNFTGGELAGAMSRPGGNNKRN
jgi:hypothetical protein